MKRRLLIFVLLAAALAGVVYYTTIASIQEAVLTGIVTSDSVIMSSEVAGRLQELKVKEGDVVKRGDLLAVIHPKEWLADMSFFTHAAEQSAAQVTQAQAELRFQEAQTRDQTAQAEANLASAEAQVIQAQADQEIARLNFERLEGLYKERVESASAFDQARTGYSGAKARVESLQKQVLAARAAVALAKGNVEQVAGRRAALEASTQQLAAAVAQKDKANVRLGYTEIRAAIDGVVDVRASLEGEVVNPGQAIVTLINPDNLWIRADVEETYIDRVRLGDKLGVRLPSGTRCEGTVFYRGVDADYATQRDVSRTKRDIKTFEIRLRCDNHDRSLAVGMTAYVTLPLKKR